MILNLLSLLGALALFLYGMKIMSEGLEKFAGNKLRAILAAMTRNRLMGVLTGILVTALIQSSSATTVMVVSFVNAGLMNLVQAIGVIMGANIGTTVTAWIISAVGFTHGQYTSSSRRSCTHVLQRLWRSRRAPDVLSCVQCCQLVRR